MEQDVISHIGKTGPEFQKGGYCMSNFHLFFFFFHFWAQRHLPDRMWMNFYCFLVASEATTVSEENQEVRFKHPCLPDTLIKIQCLYKPQRESPVPAAVSECLMKYNHGTNPSRVESLTTF